MTTILSAPTTVTLNNPGTSALSLLSASMAPGTWAQMTSISNQASIIGVGGVSSSKIHYCNKAPWDPTSRVIEILGSDHGDNMTGHFRYTEASNQFSVVQANTGLTASHGYDHSAVNPATGDLYTRDYSGFTGTIRVYKEPRGSASYGAIAGVAGSEQVAIGTCWWFGSFMGVTGCYVIFNSGATNVYAAGGRGAATDGQIVAFNPLTNSWFYNQSGKAPFSNSDGVGAAGYTYHSIMAYSRVKNVAVYGGGDAAPTKLWKIDSTGTVTAMPTTPGGVTVGVQRGNVNSDPVTGNFLVLSNNMLWELNPDGAGTWTKLTGARTPPSNMNPTEGANGVVSCELWQHGTVAYIQQTSSTGGTFWLYKHA